MNGEIFHGLLQADEADSITGNLARTVADSLDQGLALIDQYGFCLYANAALRTLTGLDAQEICAHPLHELIRYRRPDGKPLAPELSPLARALAQPSHPVQSEELLLVRKDGRQSLVACSVKPVTREAEAPCLLLEMRDLAEFKQAQARHLKDELTFRLAVEAASIGTWERDMNSDLVSMSATTARIIGLPAQESVLTAAQWQDIIVKEDLPILGEAVRSATDGGAFEIAFRVRRPDARIIWVTSRGVMQCDASGKPVRALGVMLDITEKKQAEQHLLASEERFRQLAELSPDGILVCAGRQILYANPAAARIVGWGEAANLVGHTMAEIVAPEFHEQIKALQANGPISPLLDLRFQAPDGATVYGQITLRRVNWEGQGAVQMLLRDVTELKQSQEKLRRLGERLQFAIEGIGEAVWDWDIVTNTFTFTGGLDRILDRASDNSTGTELEWRRAIHPDDLNRVVSHFQAAIEGKTPTYESEYRLRARDGSWKWVRARGAIVERNAAGKPLMMTGTMIDITARKESDDLIWHHANLDALTGLPNRRQFRERLEQELRQADRRHTRLALLFLDLDGFKQVNDLLGHDAGDLLLMEAAHRLKHCVRVSDTVARLGGDEFTVVLSDLNNLDHVEMCCQKILFSLIQPFHIGSETSYVSASIGVSLYPVDGTTSGELLRKADQAMYSAKHAGKNQFSYFTREMDEKAHSRLQITNELRHALDQRQLSVVYQPVVELASGRMVKAEALLRWYHPKLGQVEPSEFIPMAEESGLIREIGDWVFEQATQCCQRCTRELGTPFQIGVNKSPMQFLSRGTASNWLDYLSEHGLPGNSVSIEITEGLLMSAAPQVLDKLSAYREAGMEVAIDDFGTGYASMSYLQKFRIDYVKIDQSFVREIGSDPNSRTIAETIIVMAHKLGQKVIAEGIETEEQLDYLTKAGCDYGQGFYLSYPLPEEKLIGLIATAPAGGPRFP